jgi:hypothetical protein
MLLLLVAFAAAQTNPNLKWLTTYDFSPNVTHGWQNLVSGDGADLDAMIEAYKQYGMYAMPMLPDGVFNKSHHCLQPDWEANTEIFVNTTLAPYIESGIVVGIFMGDELFANRISLSDITLVSDKLRSLLGPRGGAKLTPFIYTNENGKAFHSGVEWPMVPASIDYISVDRYNPNGTVEEESDRDWYNRRIYPKLHPHQGRTIFSCCALLLYSHAVLSCCTLMLYSHAVLSCCFTPTVMLLYVGVFLVPGVFASDPVNCQKNNVSCPLKDQADQIVIKLQDFLVWAQEDYKVVGVNPWHFNNRSANQGYKKGCVLCSMLCTVYVVWYLHLSAVLICNLPFPHTGTTTGLVLSQCLAWSTNSRKSEPSS